MTEPHQPYRPRTPGPLSAGGFACAAVALIWLPVPFGLAGILLGVAAHARGETLGRWAALCAAAAMAAGAALGVLLGGVRS
jgi:hypothetical protein